MARAQQRDGLLQLRAVLVAEVGDEDDQRALAMPAEQRVRRRHVIGVRRRRLDAEYLADQRVERLNAAAWREGALPARRRAEGHRADRIALLQRDVAKQHHRVQYLVEMRAADARLPI